MPNRINKQKKAVLKKIHQAFQDEWYKENFGTLENNWPDS